jgi:hypothetical protein
VPPCSRPRSSRRPLPGSSSSRREADGTGGTAGSGWVVRPRRTAFHPLRHRRRVAFRHAEGRRIHLRECSAISPGVTCENARSRRSTAG